MREKWRTVSHSERLMCVFVGLGLKREPLSLICTRREASSKSHASWQKTASSHTLTGSVYRTTRSCTFLVPHAHHRVYVNIARSAEKSTRNLPPAVWIMKTSFSICFGTRRFFPDELQLAQWKPRVLFAQLKLYSVSCYFHTAFCSPLNLFIVLTQSNNYCGLISIFFYSKLILLLLIITGTNYMSPKSNATGHGSKIHSDFCLL